MVINTQTTKRTIVEKIVTHYAFEARDIEALYAQIESQLTITYRQVIQQQLNLYGCQKLVTGPDSKSLEWIQNKAKADTESIVRTYERELKNKVERIRKEAPKSNRFAYMRALDVWIAQRNVYKTASISLNTQTQARAYAQDRFIRENNIKGRFAPVGPPPVCKLCIRVFAKGPLTWEECQKPENKFPRHSNCPHKHAALVITKIDCATAWTG